MKGVTEFIKEHREALEKDRFDDAFISFHREQISFLQHERLVHLIVMLFVIFCTLGFLALFLFLKIFLLLVLFVILLVLTMFYVFHYYRLENTAIRWYFEYNERVGRNKGESAPSAKIE
ncbi:MAG: hypothetical protein JW882_00875 [Deltaproteobacteria bacterium]|nr:hypothetical protein [Deltaproteobacteria bacterium]